MLARLRLHEAARAGSCLRLLASSADAAPTADTIFALATPPGRAALAVVRASGPAAHIGVAALLRGGLASLPPPNAARPARLRHPLSGQPLDDALLLLFAKPRSSTGEDCAELQLHGGPAVVRAVLSALSGLPGWRPARPGEFSRRAFHHGKLDLSQLEGLADLLRAETEGERCAALIQAQGGLARAARGWRDEALGCLAHAEAGIDFGESEELGAGLRDGVRARVRALARLLEAQLASGAAERAELAREGVRCALGGAPNAGKSSLLNALSGRAAALVSSRAGTTRDVVEVALRIGAARLALVDTAGLRGTSPTGGVAAGGAHLAAQALRAAPVRLLVLDAAAPPRAHITRAAWDAAVGGDETDSATLVVLNKADLLSEAQRLSPEKQLPAWVAARLEGSGAKHRYEGPLLLSTLTGEGLPELCAALQRCAERVVGGSAGGAASAGGERGLLTRARHVEALRVALRALEVAGEEGCAEEVAAEELRAAAGSLGGLTGEGLDCEEVLDRVFAEFCIGK